MTPWILVDSAQVPGDRGELRLYQCNNEFSIRIVGHGELMNSRVHGSEEALAKLTCARLTKNLTPQLLIGGLGMGFTLAAALQHLGDQAQVVVAELVPTVIAWNRGPLGERAGRPLQDPRVTVKEGDVARIIRAEQETYDAILLDVDNGPEGLTRKKNNWLYSINGLSEAYFALRPQGVLAIWSAGPDKKFSQRLKKIGFKVDEIQVRAHGSKGPRHTIWLAKRVSDHI